MSVFALQRILPVILVFSLGCGSVCAQEGLSKSESEKLDSLRFSYELQREEITQKQFVEPMEKLRKGYRERMQKVQDRFSQTGDLTKALAARTAAKTDPTAATINPDVREIAVVQRNFIVAQERIQKRLDESLVKLARSHVGQLTTIKDRLTKVKRLDSALVVQQAIDELEYPSLIFGGSKKLKDGLVAYYPFNGNAKDESGSGYHGRGDIEYIDGAFPGSQAAYFNGSQRLELPFAFPDMPKGTLSVWIRPEVPSSSRGVIFCDSTNSSGRDFRLSIRPNLKKLLARGDKPPMKPHLDYELSLGVVIPQEWFHVAYLFSESKQQLFVNGILTDTSSSGVVNVGHHSSTPTIGSNSDWGRSWFFKGGMDGFRIYNRALSALEIRSIYDSEKP